MKKSFIYILILVAFTLNAQERPSHFNFPEELKSLRKYNDDTPASNSINDILVVGDTVWIATSRGLSKSTDVGVTWTNYYNDAAFGTESVSALAYDKTTHSIWASLAHSVDKAGQSLPEGSGLRFSTDGGENWKTVPQPLDALTDTIEQYGNNRLNALPVTVRVQNITYDIAISPNVVWIASFAGGLRKNRIDSLIANPLAAWKRVVLPPDSKYQIKPTDTLNFCLSPVSGKYCSDNNLNYRVFSVTCADDSIIFVGTANGINKTTNGLKAATTNDLTWTKYNHQQNPDSAISGNFVVALEYASTSNPKTLWAATWKAEDGSESNGVSFTQNLGANWQTTLIDHKIYNFNTYKNIVIAPSDDGAFRTTNFGNSWSLPGRIVDIKTNLPLLAKAFYSSSFSNTGDKLWLGSGEGLALQNGTSLGWTDNWSIFFASLKLSSNTDTYAFPNPFSPKTDVCKIKYSTGGKSESVTIRVFNFGMKYVKTIIQNAQRGTELHIVNRVNSGGVNGALDFWDGTDDNGNVVPNGVYFYRVDIGSNNPVFGKILVLQ